MNKYYTFQQISLTVTDPDYVGTQNGFLSPLKTVLAVFIASIITCAAAMQLLPESDDVLYHAAWLAFHILYLSGLVYLYRFLVRRNQVF